MNLLVRTIISSEAIKGITMNNGCMGMPWRRGPPQCRHLSPSHGGKVEPPKVRDSRGSIKATMHVEGVSKGKGNMPISWGWRWLTFGCRQHGRPSLLLKRVRVKGIDPTKAVVATKDIHHFIQDRSGVD